MPTLGINKTHTWDKNVYSKISLDWSNNSGEQTGSVSLLMGDEPAESLTPPVVDHEISKSTKGKITNNTSQPITYTLS